MAIQVRRGNEVDFDPSKMLPGEWAVSLDTRYVRMCFAPGIVLRMATYEAFETDMAEIQSIMAEARTIQEAVARIQTEINNTAIVVEDYAILSKSYAVGGTGTRENENADNAKYYYEQAKHISQGGNGLVPLGTIAFENLPTADILTNSMYNISNDFTSDERFIDGGGILYGKGSNVFYTVDGKWDVLAASDVKGVKGEAEDTFRQGNVNITKGNIGLENVDNTSDAGKPISDKQKAEFDRIDALLGNTDISAIGDGTLTGAVSAVNSNLTDRISFPTNERTLLASAFQSGYEYISNNDITLNVTFQPQGSASSNAYMSIIIYNEQGNVVNAVQNSYPYTVSTINILSIQMKKGQKAVINYTNCNTESNTLMLHGAI